MQLGELGNLKYIGIALLFVSILVKAGDLLLFIYYFKLALKGL